MFRFAALLPLLVLTAAPALAAEKRTGAMTEKGKLTMYEGQKFEGESVEVMRDSPSLDYDFTVGSIAVFPGDKWELCEQPRFKGVCNVMTGNETALGRITIRSARAVKAPAAVAPAQ